VRDTCTIGAPHHQAIGYARLITSSPASAAALVDAGRIESRELLAASAHIVLHTSTAELQIARTMSGVAIDLCIERAVAAKALADEVERRARWRSVEQNAAYFTAGLES
jgi:hypothetical protein